MKKRIILYFVLFGFVFGLINTLDTTGGDVPYSMMLNFPTLYTQGLVDNSFNNLERERFEKLKEETGTESLNPSLSRDELEKLPQVEQEKFVSKMVNLKNTAKTDPVIGETGSIHAFRGLLSFPILSALTWGLIGMVIYTGVLARKSLP